MPDHLLSYLHTNQPLLLGQLSRAHQYERVKRHLLEARELRLTGMKDLANYICAALIHGDEMTLNSAIRELLASVRNKATTLTEALGKFP